MKIFKRMAAQGDFIIMRVDSIPDNVKPVLPENGKFVLAHSETGHNHVVSDDGNVMVYANPDTKATDLYELFMVVKDSTQIDHLRSHDTHESLGVSEGNYKIMRQREYTPEGFRKAQD